MHRRYFVLNLVQFKVYFLESQLVMFTIRSYRVRCGRFQWKPLSVELFEFVYFVLLIPIMNFRISCVHKVDLQTSRNEICWILCESFQWLHKTGIIRSKLNWLLWISCTGLCDPWLAEIHWNYDINGHEIEYQQQYPQSTERREKKKMRTHTISCFANLSLIQSFRFALKLLSLKDQLWMQTFRFYHF